MSRVVVHHLKHLLKSKKMKNRTKTYGVRRWIFVGVEREVERKSNDRVMKELQRRRRCCGLSEY